MITLIRKLFWIALFLVFTLTLVTLFDHGFTTTKQFSDDAKVEANDLIKMWRPNMPKAKPDKSDKAVEPEK